MQVQSVPVSSILGMGVSFVIALALPLALLIRGMVRDRRAGKSACGGNCAGCGACGGCASCSGAPAAGESCGRRGSRPGGEK